MMRYRKKRSHSRYSKKKSYSRYSKKKSYSRNRKYTGIGLLYKQSATQPITPSVKQPITPSISIKSTYYNRTKPTTSEVCNVAGCKVGSGDSDGSDDIGSDDIGSGVGSATVVIARRRVMPPSS